MSRPHRHRAGGRVRVDPKNYRGLIRVRDKGGLFPSDLRLYVGRRDCTDLAEGLGWQVDAVVDALTAAGVDPLPPVTPVLCFIEGEWPLLFTPRSTRACDSKGCIRCGSFWRGARSSMSQLWTR